MAKIANFRRFLGIGVSATLAEYSVPNIRPIFAEYSAEYSVFGRTLKISHSYPKIYLDESQCHLLFCCCSYFIPENKDITDREI